MVSFETSVSVLKKTQVSYVIKINVSCFFTPVILLKQFLQRLHYYWNQGSSQPLKLLAEVLIPVKEQDTLPDREVLRHTGNLMLSQAPVYTYAYTKEGSWLLFLLITLITIISKDIFPIKKIIKKSPLWPTLLPLGNHRGFTVSDYKTAPAYFIYLCTYWHW